ncbi:guanylate kinase [Candidatus Phytoplasma oryzae]|nr:guanylate kinase [Candidatus Phytoplasma oryzae]
MKLHKKGLIIVISGPSGVGKGTIIKSLLKRPVYEFYYSVSMTDRMPRQGEKNGKDYFFVTKAYFQKKIKEKYFLEYKKFINNYYGTPYKQIFENFKKGKKVILELDVQGALELKKLEFKNNNFNKESVFIFVTPPTKKHLYERLTKRNTEKKEILIKRLQKADEEFKLAYKYDYIVVNDKVENVVDKIISIIIAEHSKIKNIIHYYSKKILKEKD